MPAIWLCQSSASPKSHSEFSTKSCAFAAFCATKLNRIALLSDPAMAERIPEALQKKLSERLHFYEDLGVRLFYKQRGDLQVQSAATPATKSFAEPASQQISYEEA